jgi:hypothetical protein
MVVQEICDHDFSDREPEVAHPDDYLADINWATAFEFGGGL